MQNRVVLFSGDPKSIGHIYRVEHVVVALKFKGWDAEWVPIDDAHAHERINRADLVAIFRAQMCDNFTELRRQCSQRKLPLIYDIDDLMFDPVVAEHNHISLLDSISKTRRAKWMDRIHSYRAAVSQANHASVTTRPLANAIEKVCSSVFVIPNVISPVMMGWADDAYGAEKPSSRDGKLRIMFASGTATHHRDFKVAAQALARIFSRYSGVVLTIVGELNPDAFPELAPYSHRIEKRPLTSMSKLFDELARADINLCPLENDNPFCEAKSAVRCLAASAVGVPSIVSPSQPLCEAVSHGAAGLIARQTQDWDTAIERYVQEVDFRIEMGRRAKSTAAALCDFQNWSSLVCRTYASII